jgi:hypothetical protein
MARIRCQMRIIGRRSSPSSAADLQAVSIVAKEMAFVVSSTFRERANDHGMKRSLNGDPSSSGVS